MLIMYQSHFIQSFFFFFHLFLEETYVEIALPNADFVQESISKIYFFNL